MNKKLLIPITLLLITILSGCTTSKERAEIMQENIAEIFTIQGQSDYLSATIQGQGGSSYYIEANIISKNLDIAAVYKISILEEDGTQNNIDLIGLSVYRLLVPMGSIEKPTTFLHINLNQWNATSDHYFALASITITGTAQEYTTPAIDIFIVLAILSIICYKRRLT